MQHYAAAAFNYTIHHASYLAAALIECAMGGVANPELCTLACVYVCLRVCGAHPRSTGVYKSNQMIVPPL